MVTGPIDFYWHDFIGIRQLENGVIIQETARFKYSSKEEHTTYHKLTLSDLISFRQKYLHEMANNVDYSWQLDSLDGNPTRLDALINRLSERLDGNN